MFSYHNRWFCSNANVQANLKKLMERQRITVMGYRLPNLLELS